MPEANDNSVHAENGRLHAENSRLKRAAAKYRKDRDELATRHETLEGEHNKFKADAESSPTAKKLAEANAKLREITHREAFKSKAKDLRPEALDDAYKLSGYSPDADVVDDAKLDAAIVSLRESKGYLFADPGKAIGEKPSKPTGPGPGLNRGGGDRPSADPFTREQMQDPSFVTRNAELIAKTLADRTAAIPR